MFCKSYNFSKQRQLFIIFGIVAFMIAVCEPAVFAEEQNAETNGWDFRVAPYMWFVALDGDVTVRGQESDLDLVSAISGMNSI